MKILILTQWYPPEPALLLQELAQTLQEFGHEVTVLTGFPNYPSGQLYPGYRLKLYQREIINGISVVRVPLYASHDLSGWRRALNYLSFALSSTILGTLLTPRPDVLFVYHPPLTIGLPARILSLWWRVPFVYQIQDMWPETLPATGMLHNPHILAWIDHFGRWIYRAATKICVISPGFQENLRDKGVPDHKIHVISNWVDTEVYYPAEADETQAHNLGLDGHFNLMFAGNIGEAQGLETILNAAKLLADLPDIQFIIVGDGTVLADLQSLAQMAQLKNVKFLGRHPVQEMPSLYALADVLLLHLKDDPLFRITIPHKIYAYMATGKPILAAINGDAADVILQAQAGLGCPPQDAQALANTVRQFYAMSIEERTDMGKNGLQTIYTQYKREDLIRQIETVLSSTCSTHTTGNR